MHANPLINLADSETESAVPVSGLYNNIRVYMNRLEGLIPSGGINLAPPPNASSSNFYRQINYNRDLLEPALITTALAANKSVLSIYWEGQLLNVDLGEALWANLSIEKPSPINHTQTLPSFRATHPVTLTPQSLLISVLKFDKIIINSYHHQKVREATPELLPATPRAADVFIEALEHRTAPFIVGVQWYPRGKTSHPPFAGPSSRFHYSH